MYLIIIDLHLPFATRVSVTPKEEPPPELFPQTPISGYSLPHRTHTADTVVSPSCLGLPCRLVHSRGVHSVTVIVHLLSLNRAMCPSHTRMPFVITSMMIFPPVWCRIQVSIHWVKYDVLGAQLDLRVEPQCAGWGRIQNSIVIT